MVKAKRRFQLGLVLLIMVYFSFFLQGCSKNKASDTNKEQAILKQYSKETKDLGITPDYLPMPYLLTTSDSHCYFGTQRMEGEEGNYNYKYAFYSKVLERAKEPELLIEFEGEQVLAFHLFTDGDGVDTLCIMTRRENLCIVTEYNQSGNILKKMEVADEDFADAYITEMLRFQDGSYVAYNSDVLYVIDDKGGLSKPIECPGAYYQKGIIHQNDMAYMIYIEENGSGSHIAHVNKGNATLSDIFSLTESVQWLSGIGERELLLMDEEAIYHFDISTKEMIKIIDLSIYNIIPNKLCFFENFGDAIRVISWDSINRNKPVQLVELKPKSTEELEKELEEDKNNMLEEGKYDADGKRIITLYDPYGLVGNNGNMLGSALIEAFNSENEQYTLVIDSGNSNIANVLAAQDSPDLMFIFDSTMVEHYQKSGYLEDLTPYIEKSTLLSMDALQDSVVEAFIIDDGLYALPKYCTLGTLMCLKSQMGERSGWTVEEFLCWLEENSDVKSTLGLSRNSILEYCLYGNLEAYIDFERRVADFQKESFRDLLARIKKLQPDETVYSYLPFSDYEISGTRLFNQYLNNVLAISEMEYVYKDELVNMGFPSDSGNPKVMLNCTTNLSILSKSQCKEGAFAFIEHCLTYEYESAQEDYEPSYERCLWTVKDRFKKECTASNEYKVLRVNPNNSEEWEEIVYDITEEDEELVSNMLNSAEPDTYEKKIIRGIIKEEIQPYFWGQKDLNTVCDIMESRVNILLSE